MLRLLPPFLVDALPRPRQRNPGTLQPGAHPMQRGQVFPTLNVQHDIVLADELNLAGDAKRKLVETTDAGGYGSWCHGILLWRDRKSLDGNKAAGKVSGEKAHWQAATAVRAYRTAETAARGQRGRDVAASARSDALAAVLALAGQ